MSATARAVAAAAPAGLFVGGAWRPAGDGARFAESEPATGAPLSPVASFDTADEAIAPANRCETGLAGYVYFRDLALGPWVAARLEVGMAGLDRGVASGPAVPFGGVTEPGLGREGGHEGLPEYTGTTMIAARW